MSSALASAHGSLTLILAAGHLPDSREPGHFQMSIALHLPEEKGTNEETEDSASNRRRKRYHWLCPKPKKLMPGITVSIV